MFLRVLIAFTLMGVSPLFSQNKLLREVDSIHSLKIAKEQKIQLMSELIEENKQSKNTEALSLAYTNLGVYYYVSDIQKAITLTNQAIEFRRKGKEINYYQLNRCYNNLSHFYQTSGNVLAQYEMYRKVIENQQKDKYTCSAHIYLAYFYANNGDYYKGIQHLNLVNAIPEKSQSLIAETHVAYLYLFGETGTPENYQDEIKVHAEGAKELLSFLRTRDLITYNASMGKIHESLKEYDESEQYYHQTKELVAAMNDSINIGVVYNNLAALNFKQKKKETAQTYLDKALKITNAPRVVAASYNNKGFYLDTNQSIEKLPFFEKAIVASLGKKDNGGEFKLPDVEEIKSSDEKSYVLKHLIDYAGLLVTAFEEESDKQLLIKAKETLYLIDELVSIIRLESQEERSKLFWVNKGVDSYMLAVKVCYKLGLADEAFYFMEKNKSLLLLENLKEIQAKYVYRISTELTKKEVELKYELLKLERVLRKEPKNTEAQNKLYDLNEEFRKLESQIRNEHPEYIQTKKELNIISLEEAIGSHVNESSNLVQYILNDKEGYAIFCSQKEKIFFQLKNIPELIDQVKQMKQLVSRPLLNKSDLEQYDQIAVRIFKTLFDFEGVDRLLFNKKLVVVPDFVLLNLPFEALKVNEKSAYLIEKVELSYLHSTSVLDLIEEQERKEARKSLLGLAPISFLDKNLVSLTRSEEQMKTISDLFSSDVLLNDLASKENFKSRLDEFKMLHLNTHAGIDEESHKPWIAFYDQKLSLDELYTLENNANLVVLDACKSADGELVLGEGVLSLSRGFFYNGTKSVIASQWNANEKANNKILVDFYKNLKKGKTKSAALREAKLNYINGHQLSEISPYFWATFSLTGNTESVFKTPIYTQFGFKVFLGFLVLLLFFMVYKKQRK
ncbi:MAG: CHAT domain-containing protein [Flavobacteriaceae bacterium]|nr:CHAT domain-containing protein [Flavobacteriaceae bacterium]